MTTIMTTITGTPTTTITEAKPSEVDPAHHLLQRDRLR